MQKNITKKTLRRTIAALAMAVLMVPVGAVALVDPETPAPEIETGPLPVQLFLPGQYSLLLTSGYDCPAEPVTTLPTGEDVYHFEDVTAGVINDETGEVISGRFTQLVWTVTEESSVVFCLASLHIITGSAQGVGLIDG